jgi:hypothetical protein
VFRKPVCMRKLNLRFKICFWLCRIWLGRHEILSDHRDGPLGRERLTWRVSRTKGNFGQTESPGTYLEGMNGIAASQNLLVARVLGSPIRAPDFAVLLTTLAAYSGGISILGRINRL